MDSKLGLLFHALIISVLIHFQTFIVIGEPQVPCYFIFGDSLVDSGNNNRFTVASKANYRPYGIDFPQGPTGRFSNGRTTADIIGELLGFSEFITPFANETSNKIIRGVNYGSGGAGIMDETGRNLGERFSLRRQLLNHAVIVSQLSLLLQTFNNEYVKKCIYVVIIGSDDYINNYLMPNNYPTSRTYNPDEYAALLIEQYAQQLESLYNLGARKIALFGIGLIGCTPYEIAKFGTNGAPCVESINNMTKLFNDRLKTLVDDLNNELTGARFTFINYTGISSTLGGVALPSVPCCQVGTNGLCVPNSAPCPIRSLFTWYDGFHPTEFVNRGVASRSYKALSPMDAYPYDISHLAQL